MYNQYHTANYRGNQPGHDQALRADSVQPSSYASSQVQGGYQNQSQRYQPVGYVQSFYQQNQQNQPVSFQQQAGFGQSASPQSYHMANYRGNQPGHDIGLRADSQNPSQSGFAGQAGMNSFGQNQFFSQNNASFGQSTNPQSYHMANYRGNQPGHDIGLRADSQNPSQSGFAGQAGMNSFGQNQFSSQSSASFGQSANPQSYHMANYRGNQPGHDIGLRADSQNPSQMGASAARSFAPQNQAF